jgi:hypothetical protein
MYIVSYSRPDTIHDFTPLLSTRELLLPTAGTVWILQEIFSSSGSSRVTEREERLIEIPVDPFSGVSFERITGWFGV